MLKRILLISAALALLVAPAFGVTIGKDGSAMANHPAQGSTSSRVLADFEWNSGGSIDFVPDMAGSNTGWGEYFLTAVENTTGQDLLISEFGFPCDGPATDAYGWVLWLGSAIPPVGDWTTCDFYGAFTPASNTGASPPVTYTYIDVAAENIIWPAGQTLVFGYDNTGVGGMTGFNGVATWAWYSGIWDPDETYGRTSILQVKGDYLGGVPTLTTTWGQIKELYR